MSAQGRFRMGQAGNSSPGGKLSGLMTRRGLLASAAFLMTTVGVHARVDTAPQPISR